MKLIFDRGTILFVDPPERLDSVDLPGVQFDPRVGALRAPAWRFPALRRALEQAGIRFVAPSPPSLCAARWRSPPPRPYQEEALDAWRDARHRGVIVQPTGSGKSFVALCAAERLGCPTLILVPTRVLLNQWLDRIREHYDGPVGCLGDGESVIEAVTCATFESAYRHMARIGDQFGLLIVDEVHHFGHGIRDEALEMCLATARLGLTCDGQFAGSSGESRLRRLIGPIVSEVGIPDLTREGYLAPYEVRTVSVELTLDERVEYERARSLYRSVRREFNSTGRSDDWAEFVRYARKTRAGRLGLWGWRRARQVLAFPEGKARAVRELLTNHPQRRVLIFTGDNQTAYRVAREHLVMPMTCDIKRAERRDVIARFASGELRALVSSRVLNEGFDIPAADLAIIVAGNMGAREHLQRIGRLLRPQPGKRARVYELVVQDSVEVWQSRRRGASLAS